MHQLHSDAEAPYVDVKAIPTARTVAKLLFPYRNTLRTIATDNGCEFAAHLEITRLLSEKSGKGYRIFR